MTASISNLINVKAFNTIALVKVHCPNCGSHAERYYQEADSIMRTQCPSCDYLMISCTKTGRVIEAYAPGLYGR